MTVSGSHDMVLVVLSILIAVFASYTALDLAGRIRASTGAARRTWLATAAIAMGGGIWAMHFVAMLAYSMPGMEVGYDAGLTALSLLVAVVATGTSFVIMSRPDARARQLAAGGLFMGLGVVAMHYMGMAAMRMRADVSYDRLWLAISILIAVGAATTALWLASRTSHQRERIGAALAMGLAIAGMHYAGMRAAAFTVHPGDHPASAVSTVGQTALAVAIASAAFVILFLSLVAAMFDRRFALLAEREATALRQSEERFRSLYRGTPLPLHSLDRAGRITQVSDIWLQLLGYTQDEVIGQPLSAFLDDESARRFVQTDWPALIRTGTLDACDYRILTKSGTALDVLAAARVEHDEAGAFLHILGGLTDITGRKQAEEALRQSQKIEAMGQLTGGVAHDFNNLLAVVIGNLDLLRKRLPDDPKAARLLQSALEGAERGASLTQRLLAFARRQNLRLEAVDVPQLVGGMADMLQRSLGPRVRVETRFPESLLPARADAHQLELAILNVAVNARDAMPDGGAIKISATEELLNAPAHGLAAGRYIRLSLADHGIGMDEATLRKAVEPFFTTKGVGKGTGLGLSMVQGLAAQSGGRMAIRSELGAGTVIEIWLPAHLAAVAPPGAGEHADAERPDADQSGAPRTILVVDDDPLVLANTAAMLEDLGHEVVVAASGREAADRFAQRPDVDLVVTDHLMPGMTGLELARLLRRRDAPPAILIVSGFADITPEEVCDLPMLRKPYTQAALARALRTLPGAPRVAPLRRIGAA